ncbi:hypothetical protein [Streptomyces lavendofoliae]|uniref:DUF3618 domain-containing protein n=1 Tax=Streptomyces lavendofoliae TaxID=67314 RepID=A0A918HTL9_9ACTN|nr:hypothetical protein [Streptomyces lavendofoliae]GGU24933.1 hypothetical protein GCM10010274_09450 [Streptomyces lavendofoliae]
MSGFEEPGRRDQSTPGAVARTAQEKAAESAGMVGDKAAEVAGTAKEQVAGLTQEATAQARDLVGELRGQLRDQAHSQTQRLAENVRQLSDELREMSENGKPDSGVGGVVRQISDGGRQVADRLEQRGPDGLVSDLQDFARRRPGVFLAGAALAGFVVARAGKGVSAAGSSDSSSPVASGQRDDGPRYTTPSAGVGAGAGTGVEAPTGLPPAPPVTPPTVPPVAPPTSPPPVVAPPPPTYPTTPQPGEGGRL